MITALQLAIKKLVREQTVAMFSMDNSSLGGYPRLGQLSIERFIERMRLLNII